MKKKIISTLLCFSLIFNFIFTVNSAPLSDEGSGETIDKTESTVISGDNISGAPLYSDFLKENKISENYTTDKGSKFMCDWNFLKNAEGSFSLEDDSILLEEEKQITFEVSPDAGLYNLSIVYSPVEGRSSNIELGVLINGKLPYREASALSIPRLWRDKGGEIKTDANDNDIRPSQEEIPFADHGWLSYTAMDSSGFVIKPLIFSLKPGDKITLISARESIYIKSVNLVSPEKNISYEDYLNLHSDKNDATISAKPIEAELPAWKTAADLVAIADRVSPLTSPNKGAKISLNTIGDNWSMSGDEIAWQFTPEESGMYEVNLRVRQNYKKGFYATRIFKINGEVPFDEAENFRFTYNRGWINYTLSVADAPCKFYFEKGEVYTLSLEVTVGEFGETLGRTKNSVAVLNDIYRDLLMIMGSNPDRIRDYKLDKQVPETIEEMRVQADVLDQIADEIEGISRFSGSELATIRKMANQLREFHKDPNEIAKRLKFFKDNIAALDIWVYDSTRIPLSLDTVTVSAPGAGQPRAEANFFESLMHSVRMFIASFFEDYNMLSSSAEAGRSIKVWSTTGRDQSNILNDMIRSYYAPEANKLFGENINVMLQLVLPDAILPSVAAGNGPDILMGAGMPLPVNYATRRAAQNLKELASESELNEVLKRFRQSAITPFEFDGGLYALPERETYPLMFYRTDILSRLSIPEPTLDNPWTWDNVIEYLPVLQEKNLQFLMETGTNPGSDAGLAMTTYSMFVLQRGGSFYNAGGISTALDSEIAVEAFNFWTKLYTNYGLPTIFDIANRFRTGEAPVVISDFTLYNQLMVSAPEIKGLWGMTIVPGTVKEDGSVDHTVRSSTSGAMILSDAQNKDVCWDYIKWWTSKDAQISFSREMESLLGASARYPTANLEAIAELPWSRRDMAILSAQGAHAKGIMETPGSYFTPRHINNAFRAVAVKEDSDEARETILKYARVINDEIDEKRAEFGLPLRER